MMVGAVDLKIKYVRGSYKLYCNTLRGGLAQMTAQRVKTYTREVTMETG